MIESDEDIKNRLVLVVGEEGWNPGVVGIVASRLVEKYYQPTIVLSLDHEKGIAKGSARSIEGFHLYNEFAKNREILTSFRWTSNGSWYDIAIRSCGRAFEIV